MSTLPNMTHPSAQNPLWPVCCKAFSWVELGIIEAGLGLLPAWAIFFNFLVLFIQSTQERTNEEFMKQGQWVTDYEGKIAKNTCQL